MSTPKRVALITGSTSGIGAEIARNLHWLGYQVAITGRSKDRGQAILEELEGRRPGQALFVAADLAGEGEAERLVAAAVDRFGQLDVVVNNAAIDHVGDLLEVPVQEVRATLETNTIAAIAVLQAAGRVMSRSGGGAIINVISRMAAIGVPSMGIYSASKGALAAITRTAAIEWAPLNIRVNSVAPGLTRTALYEHWLASFDEPQAEELKFANDIPLGRIAEPADVAHAVAFLAAEEASYITGINVPVDGGYVAK